MFIKKELNGKMFELFDGKLIISYFEAYILIKNSIARKYRAKV